MPSWRLKHPSTRIGYWPLNGNALDASGYGNDGAWAGTEAYTAGLRGRQVGSFDGASSVNVPHSAALAGYGTGNMTWAYWINMATPGAVKVFLVKNPAGGANHYRSEMRNDGTLRSYIFNDAGAAYAATIGLEVVGDSGWRHVAVVWHINDRLIQYVDGVVDRVDVGLTGVLTAGSTGTLEIGDAATTSFGDLRVYNVGLSPDEITSIIHTPVPYLAG